MKVAVKVAVPIALCMAVAMLEGFDIQAMGVAAPRLAPEFGLGPGDMQWIFAVSNIGMGVGAALCVWSSPESSARCSQRGRLPASDSARRCRT